MSLEATKFAVAATSQTKTDSGSLHRSALSSHEMRLNEMRCDEMSYMNASSHDRADTVAVSPVTAGCLATFRRNSPLMVNKNHFIGGDDCFMKCATCVNLTKMD